MKPKIVLTIAGFDPGGGAGIVADLGTFRAHGLVGTACITAMTVQNTAGVRKVQPLSPGLLRETLAALHEDLPPAGVKIGMLGSAEVVEAVAQYLGGVRVPVVLDPVLESSSGQALLEEAGLDVLKRQLLPLASVITPNLAEAAKLTGLQASTRELREKAARALQAMGAKDVIVKGGHADDNADLVLTGGNIHWVQGEKVRSKATHGTGCVYASALLSGLVNGRGLVDAATEAKRFVTDAIRHGFEIGEGSGPVNPLFRIRP